MVKNNTIDVQNTKDLYPNSRSNIHMFIGLPINIRQLPAVLEYMETSAFDTLCSFKGNIGFYISF